MVKDGDVLLFFVVGEEKGGLGMFVVNDMDFEWEVVIFGELMEGIMVMGYKGYYVFEFFVLGILVYFGYFYCGKSVIEMLVMLLNEFKVFELLMFEIFGFIMYYCGKFEGGVVYNVIVKDVYVLCGICVVVNFDEIEKKVVVVVNKYLEVELKKLFLYFEIMFDYDFEGKIVNF